MSKQQFQKNNNAKPNINPANKINAKASANAKKPNLLKQITHHIMEGFSQCYTTKLYNGCNLARFVLKWCLYERRCDVKRVLNNKILSWSAVVMWMAVIFWFSAQNGDTSGSTSGNFIEFIAKIFNPNYENLTELQKFEIISSWQLIVRKTAHFSEYAVLGILSANALRTYNLSNTLKRLLPCVICLVYATSDEIHQYFVPDRACRALDVLIDTSGGVTGVALFCLVAWLVSRRRKRKEEKAL